MFNQIISFSVKNKLLVFLGVLGLVGWGIYSLIRLPLDAIPDITSNQVQIITVSPTLAAQEVEQFITYPVEIAMATVPGISEVRSISRFGLSVVTVVFEEDMNVLNARQLVSERLQVAQDQIPPGIGKPEMAPITTGLGEIYQYILNVKPGYENKYSLMDLRTIQDWIVKRQLLGTPGIAEVSSFGGYLKQYEIAVDPVKLKGFDLSLPEVFAALEKNNQNTGGAYIEKNESAYIIRALGLVNSLEETGKIVLKSYNGVPILIRDIGNVRFGHAVRYGAMTRNNEGEAVGGIVLMLKGENSYDVIERVKERIDIIKPSLPEGIEIHAFLDRSDLIGRAIHTVSKNLIEGGLIVIFVLVLLLGNLRAGIVVASVIPLSLLFAVSLMNVFGVSGNLMSLGAIDFGLIVDGAVIIVEAIVHRIHTSKFTSPILSRQEMDNVVIEGSIKIRQSAAFGELIILIVYLPILALVGTEGKMFRPMAQTVSFAILGALVLSLTYVPMMSSLLLSRKTTHKRTISDKIMDKIAKWYEPLIRFCLSNKIKVILVSFTLLVVSLIIFSRMGGEFIPTLEEGDFAVEFRLMPGTSLSQTVKTTLKASDILEKKFPEIKEIIGKIGTAEIPTDPMPIEATDLMVILKDKSEWTSASTREELAEKMSEALSVLPGAEYSFLQPIQMRFNELATGAKQDIAVKIFGEDMEILAEKAAQVGQLVKKIDGVSDIYVEQTEGLPQILVKYKRDKLAQYGLNINTANQIARTAFAGEKTGVVYEGQKRFDMVVRLNENTRKNIDDLKNLYIPIPGGSQIPMSEVATIEYKEGAAQISRERAQRKVLVGVNVRGKDVESVVNEIEQKVKAKIELPPGYFVEYGGQFQNLQEGKARLMIAVPVALLLIFLLLYLTFGSVTQTFLIFTGIPFAAVGGVFALLIRGMPFSISAGVGFIALFGVAVLNGIVLIAYFNQLKKEGMGDLVERILTGTQVRLRPVIMTAAVASLGFLPMALSNSAGAEVQKPLATVVIGGLITSTILTLLVLPVLYLYSEKKFRIGKAFSVVLLLFILPFTASQAQDSDTLYLSPKQAVELAIKNNPAVEQSRYRIEQNQRLKKTSFDLAKTNFSINYGQYNTQYNDDYFSVNQDFLLPGVYRKRAARFDQMILSSEKELAATQNRLSRDVNLAFFQLVVAQERKKAYKLLDSLYASFMGAAEMRFKTGEAPLIEKLAAESKLLEIQNQLFMAETDISTARTKLEKLLVTENTIQINYDSLLYPATFTEIEQGLETNPDIQILQQQIQVRKAETKVEKMNALPGFSIGYVNQSLMGNYTFDGNNVFLGPGYRFSFMTGSINIPLWYKPHRARIQAAEIGVRIAKAGYQQAMLQLQSEAFATFQNYLKFTRSVVYYQNQAIPLSEKLSDFASKRFQTGEGSYIEFLQNVNNAAQIRINYLNTIDQYNQTAIKLDYLLGGIHQ